MRLMAADARSTPTLIALLDMVSCGPAGGWWAEHGTGNGEREPARAGPRPVWAAGRWRTGHHCLAVGRPWKLPTKSR